MADALTGSASFPQDAPTSPTSMLLPFLRLLAISGVSLAVLDGNGQREVIASSDEVSSRIEELQFELGEGPGYAVVSTGRAQQISTQQGSGGSAPFFDAAVQDLNVATIVSLPLKSGAIVVGVATLYREGPGLLSDEDMATAGALVHWVAGPVIERAIVSAGREMPTGPETRGKLRREVHQATGMISVQSDTSASDAFLQLRAYAYAQDETVEVVARKVITRQLNFAHLPPRMDGHPDGRP
ncbi:GAF and ANTAR domain-containing protein [Planctomonas psychrotolerans]|uniref:GAF and ANTAR domain-containing protein n=1 Tax=Planctomonas psychrotolerans TaxID=2528712 RepID=UPI00123BCD14|nr:GAF and ANTAR domain-containing protein [Planctomonas psychrotolerans]